MLERRVHTHQRLMVALTVMALSLTGVAGFSFFDGGAADMFNPRFFDGPFGRSAPRQCVRHPPLQHTRFDVQEVPASTSGAGYEIAAYLPAVSRDDIKIRNERGQLTIDAYRRPQRGCHDPWSFGFEQDAVHKSFLLPQHVDTQRITADFQNEILRVFVPISHPSRMGDVSPPAASTSSPARDNGDQQRLKNTHAGQDQVKEGSSFQNGHRGKAQSTESSQQEAVCNSQGSCSRPDGAVRSSPVQPSLDEMTTLFAKADLALFDHGTTGDGLTLRNRLRAAVAEQAAKHAKVPAPREGAAETRRLGPASPGAPDRAAKQRRGKQQHGSSSSLSGLDGEVADRKGEPMFYHIPLAADNLLKKQQQRMTDDDEDIILV